MLVLSRRADEKIVLPQLGITIHVHGVRGNAVQIGIDAPPDVKILRGELAGTAPPRKSKSHRLRNRLNAVALLTHLVERHWAAGRTAEAQATLRKLSQFVESLGAEGPAEPDSGAPQKAAPKRRTLVVDDDAAERTLLADLLRLNGVQCFTAEDGLAALDFLASHERPDFVLLDLSMPRCDGAETVARIRRDPRLADLKIFVVSGTPPKECGLATGPGGVDAWVPKPINPRTLWEAIQTHLADASVKN